VDLHLKDRRLIVLPAIHKGEAQKIAVKPEKTAISDGKPLKKIKNIDDVVKLDRHGKRHLELVKIGFSNPEDVQDEMEKRKREEHMRETIEKLKNPNNFISETSMNDSLIAYSSSVFC
jgi:hypothetical protein